MLPSAGMDAKDDFPIVGLPFAIPLAASLPPFAAVAIAWPK